MDNPNPLSVSSNEIRRQRQSKTQRDITVAKQTFSISDFQPYIETSGDPRSALPDSVCTVSDLSVSREEVTSEEVFELIRNLTDPEHPLTLEQLSVVSPDLITVDNEKCTVCVHFTPTIPHCSQATMIGLMLRVKLYRCLPTYFKIDILVTPGTHNTEATINKQLNDKERVAAALENPPVLRIINHGVADDEEANCWSLL